MTARDTTREAGTIREVRVGKEDHGIPTVSVQLEFGGGSWQGFGGLALNKETQREYVRMLCETFRVAKPDDLVGVRCYALRCFPYHNEFIEGLETLDGRRFTHTNFRRIVHGIIGSRLDEARKDLERDIALAEERIVKCRAQLKRIDRDFVDWSRPSRQAKAPRRRP